VRLGLIARADARGLGIQTKAVYDNLRPVKTLVVDCPSAKPLPLRRDWYPDATWVHGLPTAQDFRTWLQGLDVVYTAETAYSRDFWSEAERAGVKTVLHLNREFLDLHDRPTLWAAPSMWCYDQVPDPKVFLPVPIETDRFTVNTEPEARRFLHVIGRPAVSDRNGTADLLLALQYVTSRITVRIHCQDPGYVNGIVHDHNIRTPNNVTLVLESGDVPDNADLYRGHDVLVMPRRFGGLALPVNEALGSGMPVIMPNISPINLWLPDEWLTPASLKKTFMAKTRIEVFETYPQVLAAKLDHFAQDAGFFAKAQTRARELANELSWQTWKPRYEEVLSGL
jgi:glycosyltransferase involved in cell wall biosynthesis